MRCVRDKAFAEFVDRCRAALKAFSPERTKDDRPPVPTESFILLYRVLVLLRSGLATADRLRSASRDPRCIFDRVCRDTHIPLFSSRYHTDTPARAFLAGIDALCGSGTDTLPETYLTSIPIGWFGRAYQALIGRAERKKAGVYFTPDYLVRYVVERSTDALLCGPDGQRLLFETPQMIENIRIVDPAMGSGDFLVQAVETLAERWTKANAECGMRNAESENPRKSVVKDDSAFRIPHSALDQARSVIAKQCVFGLDLDPVAVEIARTSLALSVGFDRGPFDGLERNLRVGDALLGSIEGVSETGHGELWPVCFPDVFGDHRDPPGFDIVVGNPPYIAAKNGELSPYAHLGKAGQSDSYLMFVKHVADSGLLRLGGVFSMVLPDPVLARGNARDVRGILFSRWTPVSLLHIVGAFRDAVVANAVPVCRNAKLPTRTFRAARIGCLSDRSAFASSPNNVFRRKSFTVERDLVAAQPGREVLYLADTEFRRNVLSRIHGGRCRLSDYHLPFAPLARAGVERIFRGEEIGKADVMRNAECGMRGESGKLGYRILLGGQSIARYRINWEGARIPEVKKPLEWYQGLKIVLQKSAARIVAALDGCEGEAGGFIVPQSVYCIKPGVVDPFYLLAVLNSGPINDYVFRVFTGYKMLQPQIELEDIKRLPVRLIERRTPADEVTALLDEGRSMVTSAFAEGRLQDGALVAFVNRRLNHTPEQDDVLHDLLAHLAQMMIEIASEDPSGEDEHKAQQKRLAAGQRAIDIIAACLYGIPLSYALSQS